MICYDKWHHGENPCAVILAHSWEWDTFLEEKFKSEDRCFLKKYSLDMTARSAQGSCRSLPHPHHVALLRVPSSQLFFFLNNPWLCPTTSRGCCHHEASAVTALTMRCCFRARRRHAAHTASSSSPGSHRWSPSHNQSTWGGRAQPRRRPRAGTTAGGLLPLPLVQLELGGPPSCLTLGTHAVLF